MRGAPEDGILAELLSPMTAKLLGITFLLALPFGWASGLEAALEHIRAARSATRLTAAENEVVDRIVRAVDVARMTCGQLCLLAVVGFFVILVVSS